MSWTRIYVHMVFATKYRIPYLHMPELRITVFRHIMENAKRKNIRLICVNGYSDHAHCLINLNREQCLSKVVQLIKGESSHWIDQNALTTHKFAWQDDYWAVSVSEERLKSLKRYIASQEEHHRRQSFEEEIQEIF